jgi:hypothetical protein
MKTKYPTFNFLRPLKAIASMLALSVAAQSVPPLINYQGRLTDQTGAPLPSGQYTIQFRIWDSPGSFGNSATQAPDLIWNQQQNVTIQSNGVFNVILGSPGGTQIAGLAPQVTNLASAFIGSNCFVGVTVTMSNSVQISSPSEILPRQQLLSVPFAVRAQSLARSTGTNVGLGGVAISPAVTWTSPTSSVVTAVPNLSVTITTGGGPVMIRLAPECPLPGGPSSSNASYINIGGGAAFVFVSRDGSLIASQFQEIGGSGSSGGYFTPGQFAFVDVPSSGVHTYTIFAQNPGGSLIFTSVELVCFEL